MTEKDIDKKEERIAAYDTPTIDKDRMVRLMQALQRIARLQREAASAQIDARQKMREVGIKRKDVWVRDAAFMSEVQLLNAQGRLVEVEKLLVLAADCQAARDVLGPLEQVGIEAEQRWEGVNWKLRQAQENVYTGFIDEFEMADNYSPLPSSAESSLYESTSATSSHSDGSRLQTQQQPPYQYDKHASSSEYSTESKLENAPEIAFLGLDSTTNIDIPDFDSQDEWSSDSGVADIDRKPEIGISGAHCLPSPVNFEPYPHLLCDFGSRRDRINKWLQHSTLVSRMDATLLKSLIRLENHQLPSNWAQLTIAYWESDEAARPLSESKISETHQ